MNNKFIKNKKYFQFGFLILFCLILFLYANPCYAIFEQTIITIVGWIALQLSKVLGWILTIIIAAVLGVTKWSDFVRVPEIVEAWVIVRNLCNMFFILILLIIAFATILRIESYSMKRWLPKLLIMAVLINFSKTICGIAIDVSQIIMLTFVQGFTTNQGDFVAFLKVQKYLAASQDIDEKVVELRLSDTVTSIILGVLFLVVATVVMLAILLVFIMRVIMLWIYIVLSPLAFLLSSFPAGQKYASQYWGEFTRYLTNGPVLAFFVWLAMMVMNGIDPSSIAIPEVAGKSSILEPANFMSFILGIGFLVGGLMISQQIGGLGSSAGSGMLKRVQSGGARFGRRMAKGSASLVGKGAKSAGGAMASGAMNVAGKVADRTPFLKRTKTGALLKSMASDRRKGAAKKREEAVQSFLTKKLGMGDESLANLHAMTRPRKEKQKEKVDRIETEKSADIAKITEEKEAEIAQEREKMENYGGYQRATTKRDKDKNSAAQEERLAINKANMDFNDGSITGRVRDQQIADAQANSLKKQQDADKDFERNNDVKIAKTEFEEAENIIKAELEVEVKKIEDKTQTKKEKEGNKSIETRRNSRLKEIKDNETHEVNTATARGDSAEDITQIRNRYKTERATVNAESDKEYKKTLPKWMPNQVLAGAGKRGSTATATAKSATREIKDGDVTDASASKFYTLGGQTDAQKKLFDTITADDTAHISMLAALKKAKEKGWDSISESQRKNIDGLRKGIAAYMKGGNDTSKLSDVISELDGLNSGADHKNVEDWKENVTQN